MITGIGNLARRIGSRAEYARLPARVLTSIRRQQESSEVLIGWIQLGVVSTFTVLYTLSPKTFTMDAPFAPVPWALGAYFLFTVGRLWLALRARLPLALRYISVVVDMTLLLGLIFSFHIQYQQPASFYLKIPTLLYVFIFISLRALNFQVRFVVLAGLSAAFGWLVLVWYAITVDPSNPMITHNYVEYLTSNSVLIGAEFDKVITMLMVTLILAVAIARSRRLLVQSVAESVAARDLSRFVPTEVAKRIKSSEDELRVGQGELREATVLFTDLEGFTTISESMTPERLIATLNEYFAVVVEPIERHGGVINQFQGDAILATFNVPESLPDHAAAAVRAALEIQSVLRDRSFGEGIALRSRVGINTGVVVGGLVGTHERLGYTVHGDGVNLAARLEQLNKEYGTRIIVSAETRERAGAERFRFERLGTVAVRGRLASTEIYTVLGAGPAG